MTNIFAKIHCHIVRENRPTWLLELIKSFAPDSASSDDIRNELQNLLNHLRVRRISPKVVTQGPVTVSVGTSAAIDAATGVGTGGGGGDQQRPKPTDLSIVPAGAKRAEMFKNLERAPDIILLREDAEIEEKGLKGRAARYVMEASQLFVNMQYSAIVEMKSQLEAEYADAHDPDVMRKLAVQHAESTMILRVGRTVVYALFPQD